MMSSSRVSVFSAHRRKYRSPSARSTNSTATDDAATASGRATPLKKFSMPGSIPPYPDGQPPLLA